MTEILKCLIPLYGLKRISPQVTHLNDMSDSVVTTIIMWQIACGVAIVCSLVLIVLL